LLAASRSTNEGRALKGDERITPGAAQEKETEGKGHFWPENSGAFKKVIWNKVTERVKDSL